jgi:uncharacterized protein
MGVSQKAVPVASDLDRPYWEGARDEKLVLQRCSVCRLYSSQPRVVCPRCHNETFEWSQVTGRGTIYSYAIVRQTTVAGFQDEVPYVVVHVQIDEDPLCYISANLLVAESEYDSLDVGLAVIAEFEKRPEATVVQFRLA